MSNDRIGEKRGAPWWIWAWGGLMLINLAIAVQDAITHPRSTERAFFAGSFAGAILIGLVVLAAVIVKDRRKDSHRG